MSNQLSYTGKRLLGALLLIVCTAQVQAISTKALEQGIPSLAPMLQRVTPAVVSIRVSKAMPTSAQHYSNGQRIPDELQRLLPQMPGEDGGQMRRPYATGAGSGVIIDASKGLVVTNHHVIDNAAEISVRLHDGRVVEAQLLGSDAGTDIALLKIVADELVDIKFAEIETVQVGDYVVAIGNPFGIGQTVTAGIVSALGRAGLNNRNYEDFIQTDAAINVGNSGGALVDMEGHLIGINTAIISGNGGSNGVGFAVPANMVETVKAHLERDGEMRRGLLGVTSVSASAEVIAALNVNVDAGAIVTTVVPDSGADHAGVEISDVIVAVDGRDVVGSRELRNIVGLMRQDENIELALVRNGELLKLNATLGSISTIVAEEIPQPVISAAYRGALLRTLHAEDWQITQSGVVIVSVEPESRAWNAGLREGDIITEINRHAVEDLESFNRRREGSGQFMALTIFREGQEMLIFSP